MKESNLSFSISILKAFKDNYIYVLCNKETREAIVVDPGESISVLDFLEKYKYTLVGILITHHHLDHTGGVLDLKLKTKALVYGPKENIKGIDRYLSNGEVLNILGTRINTIHTPGHTLEHICFYLPKLNILFSGDILFSFGCGRIFEGSPQDFWFSLKKLRDLPEETKVYSAHEYTLKNIEFAYSLDPSNTALKILFEDFSIKTPPLLPTLVKQEKIFNPFLRCDEKEFSDMIKKNFLFEGTPLEIFKYIRILKDNF